MEFVYMGFDPYMEFIHKGFDYMGFDHKGFVYKGVYLYGI